MWKTINTPGAAMKVKQPRPTLGSFRADYSALLRDLHRRPGRQTLNGFELKLELKWEIGKQ